MIKRIVCAGSLIPPSPLLRQDQQQPSFLSLVILKAFRLFVTTIPKTIVRTVFLSLACPNCFTMYANDFMIKYKVSDTVVSSS